MTWLRHSRQIEPIRGSTTGFCRGDRGALATSVIPRALTAARKVSPYNERPASCGSPPALVRTAIHVQHLSSNLASLGEIDNGVHDVADA